MTVPDGDLQPQLSESDRPTRARWIVLAFLCLLSAVLYMDRICFSMAVVPIKQDLGIDDKAISWVGVAFTVAYGVFEIPVGRWGDRIGPRLILPRIALCWSVFTALTGACFGWWQLLAVRFLFGMGEAGAYPNTARVLARWFPDAERARAQGFLLACSQISLIVAMPLAAFLIDNWGWRWMFAAFGVFGIFWAAAFYAWFRDEPADHPAVNSGELQLIGESKAAAVSRHDPIPWKLAWNNYSIWILCAIMVAGAFNSYFYYLWFPSYLKEARDISNDMSGWLMSVLYAGTSLGMLTGGLLATRAFKAAENRDTVARSMGWLAYFLAAGSLWIAVRCDSSWALIACATTSCALMAATSPLVWSCIIAVSGRHVGSLFGLVNMAGFVGAAASQYFVGYFIGWREEQGFAGRDKWDPVFNVYVAMLLIGGICWALYRTRLVEPETTESND